MLFSLVVLAVACGSSNHAMPTSPSVPPTAGPPPAPTPPGSASPVRISVGQDVAGAMDQHGVQDVFELTAPRDGTLVVRLSWDRAQGRLSLSTLDFRLYVRTETPPIIATLPVVAGDAYRLRVADADPWDYDIFHLRYVLTAAYE